ncbi:MAG: dTDP-4-dehydrorhamnose reductase [Candidatus Uhrbacteria bacterium]
MKTLIIGAKGLLGQELVKVFFDQEVLAWDREDLDVTNFSEAATKISETKPDLIINCAAYNNVDLAEGDGKEMVFKMNAEVPEKLAQISVELGATFIQYSSDYVFAGEKAEGYQEDEPISPISEYGRAKAEGEKRVSAIKGKNYIIRPSRIFGVSGVGEGAKKNFVDLMIDLSKIKSEFDMVDEELTSPTYAPDLARRTREIVENYPPGIYHGTNSGSCTWYSFAKEIFRLIGREDIVLNPVPSSKFPRPAKRPRCSVLLNTKLPAARPWQAALAEYLKK